MTTAMMGALASQTWLPLCLLAVLPSVAAAQDRRWEIEGSVGGLIAQPTSAGAQTLPPPGPSLVTSTPTFPTRATSSWFFGDGAALVNGVLEEFERASRIAPLDPAFTPLPSARPAAFGVRVRRWLNPRTAFEAGVDAFSGSTVHTGDVSAAVEAARRSFAPPFTDLFASGPFLRTAVSAQGQTDEGSYRETAITAAFNHDVGRLGALQPYFTAGGGVILARGDLPSATLQGHYSTAIIGEIPIDETDRVSVRFTRSTTFAAVAGGGVWHDFSSAWSLRVDARMLIGPDTTRVRIDAAPAFVRGAPAAFIESFTNPAIQFSNDPSTGRRSSLSGDALQDVEVFKGGVIARTIVSVAIARRF